MKISAFDPELTRLLQEVAKQYKNSFQPRPKRGRRPPKRGGGGGAPAPAITGNLALVTDHAYANGGLGKAILYNIVQQDPFRWDANVITDPNDPAFDSTAFENAKFGFRNAHEFTEIPAGRRIQIFVIRGIQHTMFGDRPTDVTFGLMVDAVSELATRAGFGAEKALVGGNLGPGSIFWDGFTCTVP